MEEPLALEAELKNMVIPYLSLDEAAGSSSQSLATQAVSSVVEALNFVGGDLWANLQKNKVNNLLELGLRTSVVVCIFPHLHVPLNFALLFIIFSSSLLLFSSTEHSQPPPV